MTDQIFDRSPVGRENQNIMTRVHDRLKSAESPLHTAVNYDHIFLVGRNAIALTQFLGNGAAQLRNAGGWCIACLVLTQGSAHALFDVVRSLAIRFAAFKLINRCAFCPQLHNPVANQHNIGKAYLVEPGSKPKQGSSGRHFWSWTSKLEESF